MTTTHSFTKQFLNDLVEQANGTKAIELLIGTLFADTLDSGNGKSTIIGLAGRDILTGGNAPDVIIGGYGNDVIRGGNGNDYLRGDAGADIICGGNGSDWIASMYGQDTVSTGNGPDWVFFTTKQEKMEAMRGNKVAGVDDVKATVKDWAANDHFVFKGAAKPFDNIVVEDTDEGVLVSTAKGNNIVLFEGVHDVDAVTETLEYSRVSLNWAAVEWHEPGVAEWGDVA